MKESYKKSGLFLVMKKIIIELNLKEKVYDVLRMLL